MKPRDLPLLAGSLLAASLAQAAITIPTVFVGDAGNPNDSTGYGQVNYNYRIGTFEVTNAQYTAFLNSVAATDPFGLYNPNMVFDARGGITRSGSSGSYTYSTRTNMAEKPVNFVSFWDAARFTNWLTNGQPTGAQGNGTTETGVYNLGSVTNPTNNTITRDATAWANGGVAIASESEWYKAAYYDPSMSGPSDDYWLYATRSDSAPTVATANATGEVSNPGANVANYNGGADWNGQNGHVTTVGSALAASPYGTFDQGGNVREWNDAIISTSNRGLRAGSFNNNVNDLKSTVRNDTNPTLESSLTGFRVSSLAAIPEGSYAGGLMGALVFLIAQRNRRTL